MLSHPGMVSLFSCSRSVIWHFPDDAGDDIVNNWVLPRTYWASRLVWGNCLPFVLGTVLQDILEWFFQTSLSLDTSQVSELIVASLHWADQWIDCWQLKRHLLSLPNPCCWSRGNLATPITWSCFVQLEIWQGKNHPSKSWHVFCGSIYNPIPE